MAHDARAVANLLLDLGQSHGLVLTHMSVHKLAYFAHGWSLVARGRPLVTQAFEAWKYGPILRPVWNEFKQAKDKPILGRATVVDLDTGEVKLATSDFAADEKAFVGAILRAYGRFPATHLSALTHRSGGAWEKVWRSEHVVVGMRMSDGLIYRDFLDGHLPDGAQTS